MEEIRLFTSPLRSKKEQIVEKIEAEISNGTLAIGLKLPSVNQMATSLKFARQTVLDAYQILLSRGIIQSRRGLGYFVAQPMPTLTQKICFLFSRMDNARGSVYEHIRKNLPQDTLLDVFFHYEEQRTLINTIRRVEGLYTILIVDLDKKDILNAYAAGIPNHRIIFMESLPDENNPKLVRKHADKLLQLVSEFT